jgi:hypothetical protein
VVEQLLVLARETGTPQPSAVSLQHALPQQRGG